MKTKNKEQQQADSLVQFNSRVPSAMKMAVKATTKRARLDMEAFIQDAIRVYLGIGTQETELRRQLVVSAFKEESKGKLSFNSPHNAGAALTVLAA